MNSNTIILQRVVPHYREPLFEALHERWGVQVACGELSAHRGLALAEDAPWLRRFPLRVNPAHEFRARVPVRQIIRELDPHTVIAEFSLQMDSTWKLIAARRTGHLKRLVFWSHGWNMGRGFASWRDRAVHAVRLRLLAQADAQLVYSREGATYLGQRLPQMPCVVAYNTQQVDLPDEAVQLSIGETRTESRPFTLVASGRFTAEKRMPHLVSLFRRAQRRVPDMRLHLIGDGPDRPTAEKASEGAKPGSIVFHGAMFDEEALARILLGSDAAAYAGAAGLFVNQALAHGLPFITFDRSFDRPPYHHPEIEHVVHGMTGLRIRPGDDDAFVEAIAALALDRQFLQMLRTQARAYYRSALSLESYVSSFKALLDHES